MTAINSDNNKNHPENKETYLKGLENDQKQAATGVTLTGVIHVYITVPHRAFLLLRTYVEAAESTHWFEVPKDGIWVCTYTHKHTIND